MSDKKKKIFTLKEQIPPRRPMILKSDREVSKDPNKDKQDKEKEKPPPTIILKTREQSTPKDERPHSPKTLKTPTTDGEGIHPSKIAQNENKEKKEKPSPPLKLMTEPIKLLDENLEFSNSALEFLNDSSVNYLVVGVIGTQGVGKSMIMNLISQNTVTQNLCASILRSHEVNSDNTYEISDIATLENQMEVLDFSGVTDKSHEKSDINFKFKMQDMEQIERGVHCTKGIDMYVTPDRIILLDCQALFSPALIEESVVSPVPARSGNAVTVDCLQLAAYLMAVCHVLIAVQDWFTDYNLLRYIQAAEMLKPSLSASSSVPTQEGAESTSGGESHPHLLLLHNRYGSIQNIEDNNDPNSWFLFSEEISTRSKSERTIRQAQFGWKDRKATGLQAEQQEIVLCQLEDFGLESVKAMQDLYRKAFQKSNLLLNSGMYMYSDSNKNGLNVDNVCKGYNIDNCGAPLNLFLLPEIYSDFDNQDIYRGHPPFEKLAKRLRWMILGVNRHQITNVPNLSEKGWFQYCAKAWETIHKCTFFMEYERFLP